MVSPAELVMQLPLSKPVVPEEDEIASNTRARSAKLRVAERRADD